jgi:transposase
MSGQGKKRRGPKTPPAQAVSREEMAAILERIRAVLSPEEHAKLTGAIDTLAQVTAQLQSKHASIERLRRMIFGASTETSRNVLGADRQTAPSPAPKPKAPGHGRNAAAAYTGAQQVTVMHPQLHAAQTCPGCVSGKLYPQSEPSKLVRITGMAPLMATVYSLRARALQSVWRGLYRPGTRRRRG